MPSERVQEAVLCTACKRVAVVVIKIRLCTINNGQWINDGVIVYLLFNNAYTVIP